MSRRNKVLAAILFLLALTIGWPVAAHYRAQWRLTKCRHELEAKGEKLEILQLVPKMPPDSDNAARDLIGVGRFPTTWLMSNYAPVMRYIAPARALVAWREEILPTPDSANVWPGLSATLATNQGPLEDIRAALEKPALAFDLNYSQGFNILLGHLSRLKSVAQLLSASLASRR